MAVGLTGWLGLATFALSLVLMVRTPRLAALFGGLDKQYRGHHLLGLVAYLAILAHAFAVAAPAARVGDWRLALTLWSAAPLAVTGWLALGLLVLPLFVTFCLPTIHFDRWLTWHRATALAFVLALGHAAFAEANTLALATTAVMGLAALATRWWGYGARAGQRYVVTQVTHPARDVVELELRALDQPLPTLPGAYVYVAFYRGGQYLGCARYHPFSISARHGDALRLSVKSLGDCTAHMQHMQVGVAARVQGPFGALFHEHGSAGHPWGKQLWIAGGIGIAPFLAQLAELPADADVHFAYLYTSDADALHLDEIARAQARVPNLQVLTTATGASGSAVLANWLDQMADLTQRTAFICGPPGFIDAAESALRQRGLPASAVHAERFDFREG